MRLSQFISFGRLVSSPARCAAASIGKLICTSAALNSLPTNHSLLASSPSMKSSWRFRLGVTIIDCTLAEMPRAIGFTKKGIGALATLSKISLSSSGGMAEPSAKCIQ